MSPPRRLLTLRLTLGFTLPLTFAFGSQACNEAQRSTSPVGPAFAGDAPGTVAPAVSELSTFAAGAKHLFIGAGDIASCGETGDEETAAMLDRVVALSPLTTIFTTGDNVYGSGTEEEFQHCYAPSWGRHKLRTFPTIGNHDARTDRGRPYHDYFGARAGTWGESRAAMPVGTWRVLSLNSNCSQVDCSAEGPQARWLTEQLDAHEGTAAAAKKACTVVLWHHPRFSSGPHGDASAMQDTWRIVAEHRVELVLNGHDHHYERFTPFDAAGEPSPGGVVSIVVGTGGKQPYPVDRTRAGSMLQFTGKPALLALDLQPAGYQARFVTSDGLTLDRFDGVCR